MTSRRKDPVDTAEEVGLKSVRHLWLEVKDKPPNDRFLLLEDLETGDILTPMMHLRDVLDANYSRKLASLRSRQVLLEQRGQQSNSSNDALPSTSVGVSEGSLKESNVRYWRWAFESPHDIKIHVRNALAESRRDVPAAGHLRLVLLPIVYNALTLQAELMKTPLFESLHLAVKHSAYYSVVKRPPQEVENRIENELGAGQPLFSGPKDLKLSMAKYMKTFKESTSLPGTPVSDRKRPRQSSSFDSDGADLISSSGKMQKLVQMQTEFQNEVRSALATLSMQIQNLSEAIVLLSKHIHLNAVQPRQQEAGFASHAHAGHIGLDPPRAGGLLSLAGFQQGLSLEHGAVPQLHLPVPPEMSIPNWQQEQVPLSSNQWESPPSKAGERRMM